MDRFLVRTISEHGIPRMFAPTFNAIIRETFRIKPFDEDDQAKIWSNATNIFITSAEICLLLQSRPARGAWIEILSRTMGLTPMQQSHPMRGAIDCNI